MKQAPSVFPIARNLGIPTSPNFNIMHTIYGQTTNLLAGYALNLSWAIFSSICTNLLRIKDSRKSSTYPRVCPAVFVNPYASRSQHISSPKIAQLRLKANLRGCWTAEASANPVACCGVSERIKKQMEFLTVESACGGLQPAAGFFNKRWHGKNSSNCYWRYSVCMIFLL